MNCKLAYIYVVFFTQTYMSLFLLQVIQFIDDEIDGRRSNNVIVIIKSKLDLKDPIKGNLIVANNDGFYFSDFKFTMTVY